MTNKEILRLARDCHAISMVKDFRGQMKPLEPWMAGWIIDFYKIATSREREACAKICDEEAEFWKDPLNGNNNAVSATQLANSIREREQA